MADSIDASHILVMHEGSARSSATRSKEEALERIQTLHGDLEGGAEFADLARENSDCPSGGQGGALGTFERGMMVPEFENAAFGLEVGEVSDVVETDFGYHLIHRTG